MVRIKIMKYDIAQLPTDIIVNSTKEGFPGEEGVDAAIHRQAGRELREECDHLHAPSLGHVAITKGYNTPAKFIFHVKGPMYGKDDFKKLEECYLNCLKLAEEMEMKSIAFPAISTGNGGFPFQLSADITKRVFNKFNFNHIEEIKIALYDEKALDFYKEVFA
jgi:O-acetyl-ADP-ribose deacetylase